MTDWLNYHHLKYFWMVAKEGSITQAAKSLHLSQPTLSSQIQKLEKSLGASLFDRKGRSMVLTDTGQTVFRYADEIFALGNEMTDAVRGQERDESMRLLVGVPDVLPKLVVYELLKPALEMEEQVKIVLYEGKLKDLVTELALHRLDIVLADSPATPETGIKAFNHLLGECSVSICGTEDLVKNRKRDFPRSIIGAPFLLPTQNTTLRRALEQWFDANEIRVDVMHEFEDSALVKVFGQAGEGLIVIPTVIEAEVTRQYALQMLGRISEIRERFYAISVERRLKHPAVIAITQSAREELFR